MREFITGHSVASLVRMKRSQFKGSFMIVEGDTDARLYKKLVDQAACSIVNAQNRENAVQALQILESDGADDVMAVIDSDYDVLERIELPSNNLLMTDSHDIEIMMIQSTALDDVLDEMGSEDKITAAMQRHGMDVVSLLFSAAAPLGRLRWLSQREALRLKFEKLTFSRFVRRDTLTVDVASMIQTVKNNSQRPELSNHEILRKLQDLVLESSDHSQICCGHDVTEIMSIGLCKVLGSHNTEDARSDVIERNLRLAYGPTQFRKTDLFSRIRRWEQEHGRVRVLPSEL